MRKKLVFHVGHSAGFYSEINNMILAILYCRRHDIEFSLYSKDANFGWDKGWNDLFLPFCKESHNPLHHFINERYDAPTGKRKKLLTSVYKTLHPNTILTYELWDEIRHQDKELPIAEIQRCCQGIVREIYRFNGPTLKSIQEEIALCKLKGPSYIGLHIRRGDKSIEHDLISTDAYFAKAEERLDIKSAFIMSDDYSTISEASMRYPDWEITTLTSPDENGYIHSSFLNLSPEEQRDKLIHLIAQTEVVSNSSLIICSYSSNPGMFLGMREPEKCVGIDFDHWTIW